MNDQLVEQLLAELKATRESFNEAINHIKWNRINTIIQYALLSVVFVMAILGIIYYLDEKQEACEQDNQTRAAIQSSLDANASAIGIALTIVTGSPEERFQEYMDAYNKQDKPEILQPRRC